MITLFVAALFATGLIFLGAPFIAFALMLETCKERALEAKPRLNESDLDDRGSLGFDLAPLSS